MNLSNKLSNNSLFKPLLRPVRKRFHREIELRIPKLTGLVPITEFMPEDVFIVGYPKSGNTWFQNIVTGLVYGVDPEYAYDSIVQELVPDVHSKRYYKRYANPMFFKSHELPNKKYRRVVYLLRDGRDAMVSYWRMKQALSSEPIDFMNLVKGEKLFPSKWHTHVESWMENPYQAELMTIKYEDLKKNTVYELQRFCEFIGIERDEKMLKIVSEKTAFEKMSNKEKTQGWQHPSLQKLKLGTSFVRRGEIGSYKDEMPLDILETFMSEAAYTLNRYGYI
ncbi:MAG: hypothetical protein RLZZ507_2857 [Cyanobacteriota bacterium]|jgi:hypothetical protein